MILSLLSDLWVLQQVIIERGRSVIKKHDVLNLCKVDQRGAGGSGPPSRDR